jgi:hypothetical protein
MAKSNFQCHGDGVGAQYISCATSGGETVAFICPGKLVPLMRPFDDLNDYRVVCGTAIYGPKSPADWASERSDVLIPMGAFALGMLIAYLLSSWLSGKMSLR